MKIWKFNLGVQDRQAVMMPIGAKVLAVGVQDPTGVTVQLWAEVNPLCSPESRQFAIAGTGHDAPRGGEHLGTVLTRGGRLVWHVYEVAE